ncbi:hypothetical protein KY289_013605 [Solanum tuberosum]|nr:hypothetical protein KY289_013605 [Solanum tuberosum]
MKSTEIHQILATTEYEVPLQIDDPNQVIKKKEGIYPVVSQIQGGQTPYKDETSLAIFNTVSPVQVLHSIVSHQLEDIEDRVNNEKSHPEVAVSEDKEEESNQITENRILTLAGVSPLTKPKSRKVKIKVEQQSIRINLGKLIGGDFNVILYEEEKIGGLPIYPQENEDFAFCVNSYDILDIHFTGSPYTWWNGRIDQDWIFKRLDRFFVNANLLSTFGGAEVVHLSRDGSDHAPLLLSYGGQERVVRNNWVSAESDVFINLKQKLKKTKTTLSQWSNRMILQRAQAEVKSYVHYEEEYWRQKVGIQWFVEGEKNTRFFHCLGQALVAAEAELFFQDQFLDRRAEVELTLLDYIPTVINDVENEMINSLLTFEEVKAVVFELNGDSASGPRAGHKY